MMHRAYKVAIFYFTLFSLLLLYTIVALVNEKIGFSLESITHYYSEKSFEGLLEIAIPHFMAIGLFVMVLSHFFLFTSSKMNVKRVIPFYYITALVLITSTFFSFYILKLIALLLCIVMTLTLLLLLALKTLQNLLYSDS